MRRSRRDTSGHDGGFTKAELANVVKKLAPRWFLMRDAHAREGMVLGHLADARTDDAYRDPQGARAPRARRGGARAAADA